MQIKHSTNSRNVQVLVAGGLCPAGETERILGQVQTGAVWGDIASVFDDHDLCLVNLECPLTTQNTPITKLGPNLHANPFWADALKQLGFDVVTLANNHNMDMG